MLQLAEDTYGAAFKGGSATFMARIVGSSGLPLHRADVSAIAYSVFLLDDRDADARTVIAGHDAVAATVAEVIFDALQTDFPWDAAADTVGYNFRHTLDVSSHAAFPHADRNYLVEYRVTPVGGQVVIARFRIYVL